MTEDFGSRDGQRDDRTGPSPFADMIEATRLTGLGRLEEATAAFCPALPRPRSGI